MISDLALWARALRPKKPLRPYQLEALLAMEAAVRDALFSGSNIELLFMYARQGGKNETDAVWVLRFLSWWGALAKLGQLPVERIEGIRTAPTYRPGITVSKRRIEHELERWQILTGMKYAAQYGYSYNLDGLDAYLKLLSAHESAQRRGETANGFLSIDECQHTSALVADQDLNPMRSTTGAPAFYFGTQWGEESLINVKLHELQKAEQKDGRKRVFVVPWFEVALYNERYGNFVQAERDRLGPQHPIYLSEYLLKTIAGAGRFCDEAGLSKLFGGQHPRGDLPSSMTTYVGGVDFCGAGELPDEAAFDPDVAEAHDNTCAWVLELGWTTIGGEAVPTFRTVDVLFLPGQHPEVTPNKLEAFLWGKWRCSNVWLDGNGVGDGPAHVLEKRRPHQVTVYNASRPKNSAQGFLLKACIDTGRLTIWHEEGESEELMLIRQQFTLLQRKILQAGGPTENRQPGVMLWGHPTRKVLWKGNLVTVHDDGPKACALAVQAGHEHFAKRKPVDREREFEHWDDAAGWRMAG